MTEQDKGPEQTAVTEDKAVSTEATKSGDEPKDDLEELLNEWDQKPSTEQKETKPKPTADVVSREEFEALRLSTQKAQTRTDINETVSEIKATNDALKDVPDQTVEDLIQGAHFRDSRISNAFSQRHEKPASWAKVVKALGERLVPFGSKPTANADDKEALNAAVRSSTTAPVKAGIPGQEDLAGMSIDQLERLKYSL